MTTWSEAIIIGKQNYREHDRLFTVYTRECGKRTFLAQGSRKILSKLSPHLELVHHIRALSAQGKVFDRLTIVDTLCSHEYIKQDLEKLALALFCFDVISVCVKEYERDEELFLLMVSFLSRLESEPIKNGFYLTQIFLIKFFIHLGHGIPPHPASKEITQHFSSRSLIDISFEWRHQLTDTIIRLLLQEHTGIACKSKDFYYLLEKKFNEKVKKPSLSWE